MKHVSKLFPPPVDVIPVNAIIDIIPPSQLSVLWLICDQKNLLMKKAAIATTRIRPTIVPTIGPKLISDGGLSKPLIRSNKSNF